MAKCKQCGAEYDRGNARVASLFSGKCNKCTNFDPDKRSIFTRELGTSDAGKTITTILMWGTILLLVWFYLSSNDASNHLLLWRCITTLLSKGHSHE